MVRGKKKKQRKRKIVFYLHSMINFLYVVISICAIPFFFTIFYLCLTLCCFAGGIQCSCGKIQSNILDLFSFSQLVVIYEKHIAFLFVFFCVFCFLSNTLREGSLWNNVLYVPCNRVSTIVADIAIYKIYSFINKRRKIFKISVMHGDPLYLRYVK